MIDAHAHLTDYRLAPILDQLIAALKFRGLSHVVLGGVDPEDWARQLDVVRRYPDFVTAAFGLHPWTVRDCNDIELERMFETLKNKLAHAQLIGEIGVDFYNVKDATARNRQEFWCERQLELAATTRKPVVLHVVRGHDRMISMLRRRLRIGGVIRGVIHGFSGSKEIGSQYMDLGMTLSLGERSFRRQSPDHWSWLKGADVVIESDEPLLSADFFDADSLAERWVASLNAAAGFLAAAGVKVSSSFNWR